MNSDPKSVNDKLKNNQDHNPPPKDLKLKHKVEDLNYHQPTDLKMKQKVKDLYDYENSFSLYPHYLMEKELNLENIGSFLEVRFEGRERDDSRAESSKRKRITKSPEVIDLSSDSRFFFEPVKLIEEIVRIYGDYVEHIFQMANDRFNDEQRWNFDKTMCSGLAEIFSQKIERLGIELKGMKKDSNQRENYYLIEPRVRQIMNQLERMHERFDSSSNIKASSRRNCRKEELMLCIDEIGEMKKELYEILWRIEELKSMKMKKKTMEIKQRNLRI